MIEDQNVGTWQVVVPEIIGTELGKKYRTQLDILKNEISKKSTSHNPREAFLEAFEASALQGFSMDFGADTPLLQHHLANAVRHGEHVEINLKLTSDTSEELLQLESTLEDDLVDETTLVSFPVKKSVSLPFDFQYELTIPDADIRHNGSILLSNALQQPRLLDNVIDVSQGSSINIVDDLYTTAHYKTYSKYNLPIARIIFRTISNGPLQPLTLVRVELVVHYEPPPVMNTVESHLDHVINAGVGSASVASTVPLAGVVDGGLLHNIHNTIGLALAGSLPNQQWSFVSNGLAATAGEPGKFVIWGPLSQLAVSHAIVRLVENPQNDLTDHTYIGRILQSDPEDSIGQKLYGVLNKIYGSMDKLPSLRDFLLNATGLNHSLLESSAFTRFGESINAFFTQLASGKAIEYVSIPENIEELTFIKQLEAIDFGDQLFWHHNPVDSPSLNIINSTILSILIIRLGQSRYGKRGIFDAQTVISKVLRLESVLKWDVVPSQDGTSLIEGPHSIFTLGSSASSTIEGLGAFIKQFTEDYHLVKHLLTLPIHHSNVGAKTMSSLQLMEVGNNIQVYFATGGFPADGVNIAMVFWCPRLGFWGVFDTRFSNFPPDVNLNNQIFKCFMDAFQEFGSQATPIHPSTVPLFLTHVGERHAMTTNDITEDPRVDAFLMLNLTEPYRSPIVNLYGSQRKGVRFFRDPEKPKSRLIVRTIETNIPLFDLVYDARSHQFFRLGDHINNTDVRVVHNDPVQLDRSVFMIKDYIFYRENAEPAFITSLPKSITDYQDFEIRNPFSNISSPLSSSSSPSSSSSSSTNAPLLNQVIRSSIHQLPFQDSSTSTKIGMHKGRGGSPHFHHYHHHHPSHPYYYNWPRTYAEWLALNAASGLLAQEVTGLVYPPPYVRTYYTPY
jgi:hypothetical protein